MIEVKRRARSHPDRGGDPLDGLVNLFDLGIVLALAFLIATLSSLKLADVFTRDGAEAASKRSARTVTVSKDKRVKPVELDGRKVVGEGKRVGSVYRLRDGRTVFVEGR